MLARKAAGGHRAHTEWRQLATAKRQGDISLIRGRTAAFVRGSSGLRFCVLLGCHVWSLVCLLRREGSEMEPRANERQGPRFNPSSQASESKAKRMYGWAPCLSREDNRTVIALSIFPRNQYQECHKSWWSSAGWKTELSTGYLCRGRRAAGKQHRSRHALSNIQFLTQGLALKDTQCMRPEHMLAVTCSGWWAQTSLPPFP